MVVWSRKRKLYIVYRTYYYNNKTERQQFKVVYFLFPCSIFPFSLKKGPEKKEYCKVSKIRQKKRIWISTRNIISVNMHLKCRKQKVSLKEFKMKNAVSTNFIYIFFFIYPKADKNSSLKCEYWRRNSLSV